MDEESRFYNIKPILEQHIIEKKELQMKLDDVVIQLEAIKNCNTLEGAYFHAEIALERIREK